MATVDTAWRPDSLSDPDELLASVDSFLRNSTLVATKKEDVIFDNNNSRTALSTSEILLIAIGISILITLFLLLGLLAVCKWRKKTTIGSVRAKANGHDRILNGGVRQPLFGSKKYQNRPEIVITEATSDDRRSSGQVSVLEVHSPKSIAHVPPCSLAILEDLDECELISPAVVEHNTGGSTMNFRTTNLPLSHDTGAAGGVAPAAAVEKSINHIKNSLPDQLEGHAVAARPFRLERTESDSSTDSYKQGRPNYSYAGGSPHGMQPYGIGDHASVSLHTSDECSGPLLHAVDTKFNPLNANSVDIRQ